MNIKKGDTVVVIAGKDKGKKGKVLLVNPTEGRVIVEGINKIKKHQKPSRTAPQGGILTIEAPLNISNVMLWDSKANKPTRVGKKILNTGEKVRVSKRSGETLDK